MMSENLKIGVLKIMLHMFVKIIWRILLKVMRLIFVKIIWRKFSPILALRLLHSAGVVTVVEQLGFAAISDIVMMGGGGVGGGAANNVRGWNALRLWPCLPLTCCCKGNRRNADVDLERLGGRRMPILWSQGNTALGNFGSMWDPKRCSCV